MHAIQAIGMERSIEKLPMPIATIARKGSPVWVVSHMQGAAARNPKRQNG